MTNESLARVIITILQSGVHTDQSLVTTIGGVWSKDQCCSSVYLQVQDSVTTYSLCCVLSTSMTFPCAMKTVRESPDPPFPVLVMQYIQRWGRVWSGSRDYVAATCILLCSISYITKETRYLRGSLARNSSRQKTPTTESPPSVKLSRTTSNPERCSFVAFEPPKVSLPVDLHFLPHASNAPSLVTRLTLHLSMSVDNRT